MSQAGSYNAGTPPPGTVVISLTGNIGGPVGPDGAGNIDVVGVDVLTVTGIPANNELEISLDDGANGQLIIGGGGAGAAWADLTSTGGTIDIAPGVNTLNIETAGTVATTYATDAGNAIPAAGILNVLGGDGISTSGAGNTVTITADNAGFNWQVVTVNQIGADNQGFFTNDAGPVDVALPALSDVGDTFQVSAMSAGGWTISQGAGQQIRVGISTTTIGITGSLASTAQGDWVTLVCSVADTSWMAKVEQGNITII